MDYWIFVVTEHKTPNGAFTAQEIYKQRMADEFWGITQTTPNRRNIKRGDKVVFYVGQPNMVFAGTAVSDSSCFLLNKKEQDRYGHGKDFYTSEYGVRLKEIENWKTPKSVKSLVSELSFIENQQYWFTYFQGGVRQVTERDFQAICGSREISFTEHIEKVEDLEDPKEFALESHLEDFIFKNWRNIKWGSPLELFETEEQNGRQFPAGVWSIDFLAKNRMNGDIVVIELKKGKTSDAVVGQLLRYMGWVKRNLAEEKQSVRGIIVAGEVSEKLRYSVQELQNVDVKTYSVDFKLVPFQP